MRRDEAAHEQRRGNGAGLAAADIVDVGDFGLQHRLIRPPQWQPPQRIVLGFGGADQFIGEPVVVGEKGRHVGPERDTGRAGQRGEVGDQRRLVLIGERQRIGQDQPAFGVGIADFDGDALARSVDVARAEARPGNGVFDGRN